MSKSDCIAVRCSHYAMTDPPTLAQTQQEGWMRVDGETIHWYPAKTEPTLVSDSWRVHLVNARGGSFDAEGWYVYPGTVNSQYWRLGWEPVR